MLRYVTVGLIPHVLVSHQVLVVERKKNGVIFSY